MCIENAKTRASKPLQKVEEDSHAQVSASPIQNTKDKILPKQRNL